MSAESLKDFLKTTEQNETIKLTQENDEKILPNTEEKIILPLDHKEEKDQNQPETQPRKKKHRAKKIIIIETPAPEPKKKMKKIHIKYKNEPKTIIQQIKPEMPVARGPKTISLIRNTPKYRPVILAQPQPLILTQVAVPLIRVPVYSQNIRMAVPFQANKNFQKIAPNQTKNLTQNFDQNRPGHPRSFGPGSMQGNHAQLINPNQGFMQPRNGQMINTGPGPGFGNLNGPYGQYGYNQQIIKKNSEQEESDRGPSPILLFHDKEEDDDLLKKGDNAKFNNGDSLNDESQTTTSRYGAKSKFGRNKLDFISNLFDGYYYTNIDYQQDSSVIDNELVEKIQPLEKSANKEFNSNQSNVNQSSARFSNAFTNSSSLPAINKNAEFSQTRQPVQPVKKFASGQIYPTDRMSQSGIHSSVENLPPISPKSKNEDSNETRVKSSLKTANSKKSNESDIKRLNYPRNTVLANN